MKKYIHKIRCGKSDLLIVFIWCTFSHSFADTRIYHYVYDNNGNTIAINQINGKAHQPLYTYRYNNLNQMVGFEDIQNQKTFGYVYYPDGRRLSKQGYSESGQEAIVFYYGHQGQLMNESYSKNNETIKQSSYFAGLRFIDDLIHSNDSHIQYPMADQHNHPATLSFAQGGSRIESYQLTDYGQLAQSNIKQAEIATQADQSGLFNFELNPKVYGSGYYDSESNLQYMGARYYSADTERFMAQDSYNLLNRYNYANANPVMNYDPDGHSSIASWFVNSEKSIRSALSLPSVNYGLNGLILISAVSAGVVSGGNSLLLAEAGFDAIGAISSIVAEAYSGHGHIAKSMDYINYAVFSGSLITGHFASRALLPGLKLSEKSLKGRTVYVDLDETLIKKMELLTEPDSVIQESGFVGGNIKFSGKLVKSLGSGENETWQVNINKDLLSKLIELQTNGIQINILTAGKWNRNSITELVSGAGTNNSDRLTPVNIYVGNDIKRLTSWHKDFGGKYAFLRNKLPSKELNKAVLIDNLDFRQRFAFGSYASIRTYFNGN